ncbi:MAG: carboxylating nicotinate-nucleotide diphosphorylase [Deltaproteobacteria bacterium]|nr:carboxylating nicotinate-nucleotide diphosphorylase [Deltaproteobacteria bacterium]
MSNALPFDPHTDRLIELAFAEDFAGGGAGAAGDVTSLSCIDPDTEAHAVVVAKQDLVLAGISVFARVFGLLDSSLRMRALRKDGDKVKKGASVLEISGNARNLLLGERTALNFLQRLSGVATKTNEAVVALEKFPGTRLLDTRKTTPGFRALEKAAVKAGGGTSHRAGLFDGVMIKENHIVAAGGIQEAVRRARRASHHLVKIEVETESLAEVQIALDAGADCIMLDNMSTPLLEEAVALCRQSEAKTQRPTLLEASGNMSIPRLPEVAACGVDFISVGALTHSADAADLSLLLSLKPHETGEIAS